MNVCIFGSDLNPPFREAQRNLAMDLAKGLVIDGHSVHVVTERNGKSPSEERVGQLYVHRYPRLFFHAVLAREISQLARRYKFDVIQNQNLNMQKLEIPFSMMYDRIRIPLVGYVCVLPLQFRTWMQLPKTDFKEALFRTRELTPRLLSRIQMRPVKKIVASSHFIKRALVKLLSIPETEIEVIHPFVDMTRFEFQPGRIESIRKQVGVSCDTQTLLFIGSHYVPRGEKDFLEALSLVLARFPHARGVLVSAPPMPRRITRLVETLGLREAVNFIPGQVDIPALLSASTVYVFSGSSSLGGGSIDPPLTIIEAMATGTPCVAYDTGGIQELKNDGRIHLVEDGNTCDLAEAICEVLEFTQRSDKRSHGSLRGSEFDVRNATRRFVSVYKRAMERFS
jgi:glycosyltransferase involved in cell wall biosynthesis